MNTTELTILLQDEEGRESLPRSGSFRVLRQGRPSTAENAKNIFVLTTATMLPRVAEFVKSANRKHHLCALFVRQDADPDWLPQIFARANLRVLRNTLVHSGPLLPRRVIKAWSIGAQDQLIANASLIGNKLFVVSCALEEFEIGFDAYPALRSIPRNERTNFEVTEDGSSIHWPSTDVHLDLDDIRYATVPDWRKRAKRIQVDHDSEFGAATALVRKKHDLRQSDIKGLSERQVRRIESGERTTAESLELLSAACGMELDEYLNEVAQAAAEMKTHHASNAASS